VGLRNEILTNFVSNILQELQAVVLSFYFRNITMHMHIFFNSTIVLPKLLHVINTADSGQPIASTRMTASMMSGARSSNNFSTNSPVGVISLPPTSSTACLPTLGATAVEAHGQAVAPSTEQGPIQEEIQIGGTA
jgi:hypothetical protein